MNRIAFIFGTRPEIIKLAPIIRAAELDPELEVLVISTGQHREMAAQALESFGLIPEIDLSLMTENQTPNSFLAALLSRLEGVLLAEAVDYVVVQGDTTSALGGALTAFHLQLPIAHVEAGLRTYDLASPFPEEMNRSVISKLATLHFCPTPQAAENLAREGITEHVFTVGNSIVDALQMIDSALLSGKAPLEKSVYDLNVTERRYLLVTGHRRENFFGQLENLCQALAQLVLRHPGLEVIFPVHLNPTVKEQVHRILRGTPRIHLLPPVNYPTLIYLLKHCLLVISDSGGIQEEAPSFGKRVMVTRATTERTEAITAGFAELVSLSSAAELLNQIEARLSQKDSLLPGGTNPFGDGKTSQRILEALKSAL